jgi:hypothetical protein
MFFQLLYIHLFRPFLKYSPDNSPLPPNVSPRKQCTQAAAMISKLLRLYKRSHGLRQICNICVYIAHSACTIHLLNLPDKNAKRDIIHGIKHLEEIAEGWLCARRTLGILSVLAKRWKVELPEEAAAVLARTDEKFGPWNEISTPKTVRAEPMLTPGDEYATSPTQKFSPSLQPYNSNNIFARPASSSNAAAAAHVSHPPRPSASSSSFAYASDSFTRDPSSIPPVDLAHSRLQRHPSDPMNHTSPNNNTTNSHNVATPASTQARQSIDGGSSVGASPSQMFGGVDQLIREGQDWIFRDQTQLASGFDNWASADLGDVAGWFGAGTSPGMSTFAASGAFGASGAAAASSGQSMNGGPVGGAALTGVPNGGFNVNGVPLSGGVAGNGSGNAAVDGLGGFTYDELSWYGYE